MVPHPNSFKRYLCAALLALGLLPLRAQFSKNITLAGHLPYNECVSALWGYTAPDGREYALVGTCSGTSIVDITDPAHPQEKYFVPGPQSIWREMKTYGHYAYIVTEGGNGLTIVDLQNLPGTNLSHTVLQNVGVGTLANTHTIFIDEKGRAFLWGSTGFAYNGQDGSGCVILDLAANPVDPPFLGIITHTYYHDGFVRNDTLWGSAIYDGYLEIYDISDLNNPQFLGNRNTPGSYTHNAWPGDDGKTVFTTDEVPDASVTAYDISDVYNIRELDRVQMDPTGNETPHNVHYKNGWLPTAYYREGAVIIDAHRPQNMVVTGYYDTHWPDTGSNPFEGVWEVYPFFPSGRMIAGDRSNGLFILNPKYVRAGYLEGTVTDTSTGLPISGANVFFSGLIPGDTLLSAVDGTYKTGAPDSGLYMVTFSRAGYHSKTFYVTLEPGQVTQRDAALLPIGYVPPPPPEDFSNLEVWPVPASSLLEIRGIPFSVTEVQVVDLNGKILLTNVLNQVPYTSMDVSGLASGPYFLFFRGASKKPHIRRIVMAGH